MANWRRFIPRLHRKDPSEARWRRRARTRDARVAMADRPDEVTNLAPVVRAGNGATATPFPDAESKGRGRLKKLRVAIVVLGLCFLALVSWVFGIMMAVAQDLPRLEARAQYAAAENTVVYARDGDTRLATLTNNEGRILVDSDEIAPLMKEAVVAIEDARFYDHRGVDFEGIARALYQDVLSGSAQQGASTITQQFVKNALEAQGSRTILQKLREAALAYQLERNWNKDKILTEYLNSIYFGEGAYGIEAAARTYFGWKHPGCGTQPGEDPCASQLLPWEAAMLAGIISSPSAYSPRANPEAALSRRNLVLQNMVDQGDITSEEYAKYAAQPIPRAADIEPPQENSVAPYFTSWLRQQLVDKYGAGEAFGGGLEVVSTMDLDFQESVEEIASSTLAGIEPTASVVVLDNPTAQVLAMVGGNDFEEEPFNLATNGHRQPGSAFKPFTLITALQQGRSPSEVLTSQHKQFGYDIRAPKKGGGFKKPVHDLFDVSNYEDTYYGSSDLATATTHSDNSVYAELGIQVGVQNVAQTAKDMGITSDLSDVSGNQYSIQGGDWEPYNPALILGGLSTGVTPLEKAHAYETIAMGGKRISGTMAASDGGPVGIGRVTDEDGDLVETLDGVDGEDHAIPKQVIDPEVAATTKSILQTVVSSGTGTNAQTDEPTFGKTGTTDDNGDAWFCGATDEITACVWVGYADSRTPMKTLYNGGPVDGGTYPAIIFAEIVNAWEDLQAAREDEEEEADSSSVVPTTTTTPTTYTTPTTTSTPTTTTPTTTEAAPPADEDTQPAIDGESGGAAGKGQSPRD